MDYIFTYDRDSFEKEGIKSSKIKKLIEKHESVLVPGIQKCIKYYLAEHASIEKRNLSNLKRNPVVANHAKDIADTSSGYFMGNPITYQMSSDDTDKLKILIDAIDYATADDDDQENALMLSICGRAYEYIYPEENEPNLLIKPLDPLHTFIVCDRSIEHSELFAVYYYRKKDDAKTEEYANLYVTVCTDTETFEFILKDNEDVEPVRKKQHRCGFIPIVEYKNNKFAVGDFEQQIGLIDAYNALTEDRITDKEQFIDAILVIYGAMLGDTRDKSHEAMETLGKEKLLELDTDAKAEYLTRTFDENGMEILRKALKEDIYTFSHVPNLSDENFAGNSSGVAMEYKLLGLEMLTKIKERWYRRGLRKRLRILLYWLNLKSQTIDESDIIITFSRSLPKNLLELSQIINNLEENVSARTLLSLLPFVENPDEEIEAVEGEKDKAVQRQQEAFRQTANSLPDGINDAQVEKDE